MLRKNKKQDGNFIILCYDYILSLRKTLEFLLIFPYFLIGCRITVFILFISAFLGSLK